MTQVIVWAIRLLVPAILTFLFFRWVIGDAKRRKESNIALQVFLALLAAGIPLVSAALVKTLVRPTVEVSTVRDGNAVEISIKSTDGFSAKIDEIFVSYPIPGRLTSVSAPDPTAATHVEATALGGDSAEWLQNQLQLRISVAAEKFAAIYRAEFTPADRTISLRLARRLTSNLDRYHVVYVWRGYGAEGRVEEWRLVSNDAPTNPPDILVAPGQIQPASEQRSPIPRRPL